METSEVRRRLNQAIEHARRVAAAHRSDADLASSRFERFAHEVAAPLFRQAAQALRAEGFPFQVFTPSASVRLASERSGSDYVELALDTARNPVALLVRSSQTRGHHLIQDERVVFEGPDLERVDEEKVLGVLLESLAPMLVR